MKTLIRLVGVLIGLGAVRTMLAQAQPQAQQPVEFDKSDLLTEQRIMKADIEEANFYVDRGIKAVGSNLPEVAKVSVLRATGRIAKVEELMNGHPERIERLALVLFQSRATVRAELQKSYRVLRDSFSAVESSMYALRLDMLRKGIFGEELKQQVAVLKAASDVLPEIEKSDPARAKQIRDLIEEINQMLANNDTAGAKSKIAELNTLMASAGYGGRVDQEKAKINAMAGGTGGAENTPPPVVGGTNSGGSQTATQPDGSTVKSSTNSVTLPDGRKQDTVVKETKRPDGTSQVVRTVTTTNPDGSKDVTETTEERDANGNVLSTKTAQYTVKPDGTRVEKGSVKDDGKSLTITDSTGKTTTVPKSFFHGGNEGIAYDTVYVGGEGQTLTAEREVKITLKRDDSGSITAEQHPGREREWAFVIAEVPGARKFDTDGMATSLTFQDNKRKTDFKIESWSIKNPQGQEVGHFGAQNQVDFKFPASGAYTLSVTGETDWGNKFAVSVTLNVAL